MTDDFLKRLKEADEANRKRIEASGGEGSIVLTRVQFDKLMARLQAAEGMADGLIHLHKRCEQFEANPFPKIYGLDHSAGTYENCDGCSALMAWRKAAGKVNPQVSP